MDRPAGGPAGRGGQFRRRAGRHPAPDLPLRPHGHGAKDPRLKKRTLTNLYNERPLWLKLAHEKLDRAVLAAYAAIDPEGDWSEDWAQVWVDSGAGQALPAEHPLATDRQRTDQAVLRNLLRLNGLRQHRPG